MADTIPTLSISAEKVCFIVVKVREFDVKDVLTDEDDGSNAADDGMVERSPRIIPMTRSSRSSLPAIEYRLDDVGPKKRQPQDAAEVGGGCGN